MISSAVFKLSRGDVDNPFSCPLRYLVDEAEQVLIRIPEAHSTPDTRFKIRGGTRHIERNHTLIRVPYVYHSVQLVVVALKGILGQQIIPIGP